MGQFYVMFAGDFLFFDKPRFVGETRNVLRHSSRKHTPTLFESAHHATTAIRWTMQQNGELWGAENEVEFELVSPERRQEMIDTENLRLSNKRRMTREQNRMARNDK